MTRSLFFALFVAASIAAMAQGVPGAIEGRVSDTQQLALPQATVELEDAQGRVVQKVVSDGNGHYQFSSVSPGSYTVRFSHVGFEATKKVRLRLQIIRRSSSMRF
jgi:protocatechuate 3,4-dioxygenase beta subunit